MAKVTVKMVPVDGEPVVKEVDRTANMTVAQALQAAGIDPTGKNITVSKPATGSEPVNDGEVITVEEAGTRKLKAGESATVTERPRGS